MTAPFFDTIVMCTVTGLAICCSGVLGTTDLSGHLVNGTALTILAFESVFGPLGAGFVAVSTLLFAFSTILGWEYLGESAFSFLTGERFLRCYRIAFAAAAFPGACSSLDAVFYFSDICNALMCIPNLLSLLLLSREVSHDIRLHQHSFFRKKL